MNNPHEDDMQFSPLCDDMRVYEEEEEEGSSLQLFAATVRNRISNTTELEMQSLLGGTNSEHENSNRNAGNNHSSSLFTRNFTHAGNTNNNSVVSSSFAVEKEEDEQASTARHKIICPMKNLHVRTSKSSDETDPEVFMTRTLSQIDILEDDFDEFTHKKLLPVPIQIALEENIFGWSHLLSDVLGHILYPLISAVFTYQAISLCYYAFNVYDGRSASSYHQQQQQQQQQHNNGEKEEDQSKSLSPFLVGVRNLMTVASLIASYRTVRRRRKVWLTHYDPKLIYSVDRDTEMGRKWHDQYYVQHSGGGSNKSSKLRKKVERASRKYDAKLRQVQKKKTTGQEVILAKKRETPSSTTTTATDMNILACSSSVVTKISHINNMLYTHGGYFASAPYMLHDPQWIYILRQLMPDVYVEVARRVHLGDAKLIHWAENNPVVAAYGTIMSCTSSSSSSTAIHNNNKKKNSNGGGNIHSNINMDVAGAVALEWDVFLDPILTSHLVTALDVQSTISKNETTQLKHVNNLIQTRALHLVANMLIAHGNATQLIMEQIPYPRIVKSYNFTRVKHARKTLGGGIEVSRWLAIYAAALKMGWKSNSKSKSNYQQNSAASTPLQSPENSSSDEDEDEDDTEGDEDSPEHLLAKLNQSEHIPLRTSIATVKKLMNKELTVLLDIKSRHVDKRVWALVVSTLQKLGISIEGIGSFFVSDIRGISDMISSQGFRPCREVIFFHSVGDLQFACHQRQICNGDTVFFNSGSLFQCDFPTDRLYEYKERYNLRIGLYTQEFAVDPVSIQHIVDHVNDNSELYDLGLSWGGVNGITVKSIQPGRFTCTDGYWNQRYLGKYWRADIEVGDEWQSSTCDAVYGTFQ